MKDPFSDTGTSRLRVWRQSGNMAVEYSLVTLTIAVMLFAPMPLLGMSVVEWLLDAIRGYQFNAVYLLSLP